MPLSSAYFMDRNILITERKYNILGVPNAHAEIRQLAGARYRAWRYNIVQPGTDNAARCYLSQVVG